MRGAAAGGRPDVVPLNGTGQGERDPGMLLALARFGAAPCVVLGQDRRGQPETPLARPGCARPAAGCGWPPSSDCRWCR